LNDRRRVKTKKKKENVGFVAAWKRKKEKKPAVQRVFAARRVEKATGDAAFSCGR